jgi:hypothetical protein
VLLQRPFDGLDRAIDAGAVAPRLSQEDALIAAVRGRVEQALASARA